MWLGGGRRNGSVEEDCGGGVGGCVFVFASISCNVGRRFVGEKGIEDGMVRDYVRG